MSANAELLSIPERSLDIAEATLLRPCGLDNGALQGVLGSIMSHEVDFADLYFQYTRSEGWSLEEGQVKSGSFSIEQGVGVRAVSGEKTAFAYSDEIGTSALASAAKATRAIARHAAAERSSPRSICSASANASPDRLAATSAAT